MFAWHIGKGGLNWHLVGSFISSSIVKCRKGDLKAIFRGWNWIAIARSNCQVIVSTVQELLFQKGDQTSAWTIKGEGEGLKNNEIAAHQCNCAFPARLESLVGNDHWKICIFHISPSSWPLFLKVCWANFFISLNRFVQPYHHMYRLFFKYWEHFLLNRLNLLITCITYFLISPQSCSSVSTPGSKSLWAVSFSFASTFSLKQNNADDFH